MNTFPTLLFLQPIDFLGTRVTAALSTYLPVRAQVSLPLLQLTSHKQENKTQGNKSKVKLYFTVIFLYTKNYSTYLWGFLA